MINITHGIYNILKDTPCHSGGFYDAESRKYLPLPLKFRDLLKVRGEKFLEKYNIGFIKFVYAIDTNKHISSISICHPHFDFYSRELGESIAVGRIRRMRGDLQKTFYEIEHYIDYYYRKNKEGEIVYTKEVLRKRVKLDDKGEPIVRKQTWFKPYDLQEVICDKDGEFVRMKYPYIHKLVK